jgi:luciferase-type oxidoreductase
MSTLHKIATQNNLTLGLVFPLEAYNGSVPQMKQQEELAKYAEEIGMSALWFRDVPLHDPTFGDAGQMFDPFVYMAHIMNHTSNIALATGSIILPLRHPIHTAKSINSLQLLSQGRVIIGVASGDRPIEFPAFGKEIQRKGELFRESFGYLSALNSPFPNHDSKDFGSMKGNADLLPKTDISTPLLVTGHSGQSLDWIAKYSDGWLYYPRNRWFLEVTMDDWTQALKNQGQAWKPYMQSLYIDLVRGKGVEPTPIHLGFRFSVDYLLQYLNEIKEIGVNHVILNLKFSSLPVKETLDIIGKNIIPNLSSDS